MQSLKLRILNSGWAEPDVAIPSRKWNEIYYCLNKKAFNSPFRVNVGSQTMCFPYHPNDPNLIPFSMTGMGGISKKYISRAATCNALPMAHAEQVRCQMGRACRMSMDYVVSHLMNFPINLNCSEMIVCLIMMLLNSQMLTSCWMMILSFAEESSWESCWGLSWD